MGTIPVYSIATDLSLHNDEGLGTLKALSLYLRTVLLNMVNSNSPAIL